MENRKIEGFIKTVVFADLESEKEFKISNTTLQYFKEYYVFSITFTLKTNSYFNVNPDFRINSLNQDFSNNLTFYLQITSTDFIELYRKYKRTLKP